MAIPTELILGTLGGIAGGVGVCAVFEWVVAKIMGRPFSRKLFLVYAILVTALLIIDAVIIRIDDGTHSRKLEPYMEEH